MGTAKSHRGHTFLDQRAEPVVVNGDVQLAEVGGVVVIAANENDVLMSIGCVADVYSMTPNRRIDSKAQFRFSESLVKCSLLETARESVVEHVPHARAASAGA